MKIVAINGSPNKNGNTYYLLDKMGEIIKSQNIEFEILNLNDAVLKLNNPFCLACSTPCNQSCYKNTDFELLLNKAIDADAIIFGTPVFQASIPATLKNIFDLLPQSAFRDKVVSILVTAGSSKHYLIAEQQLKPILAYMKAQIVQTYVFIEEESFYRKEITNDDVLFRIDRLVEDTIVLTETYTEIRKKKEEKYDF